MVQNVYGTPPYSGVHTSVTRPGAGCKHAESQFEFHCCSCILAPLDIASRTKTLLCISKCFPTTAAQAQQFLRRVLGPLQRLQRREIPATALTPCNVSVMLHRLPLVLKSLLCRPAAPVISRCRREFSLGRSKADFTVSRRCAPRRIQPRFSSKLMHSLQLDSGRRCRAGGTRDRSPSATTCSADFCSWIQQEQFRVVHIRPFQRRPA